VAVLKVPLAHVEHVGWVVVVQLVPAVRACPAGHVVIHVVQAADPTVSLNFPLVQVLQVGLVVPAHVPINS
jgi:hypothetical protein